MGWASLKFALLIAALSLVGSCREQAASGQINKNLLTNDALGSVRIGMNLRAVKQAVGTGFKLDVSQDPTGKCAFGYRADRNGVSYLMTQGKVIRIDIEGKFQRGIHTVKGTRFGTTVREVRKMYGNQLEEVKFDSDSTDFKLIARDPRTGKHGIAFYVENGLVTWLYAGEYSALLRSESCL